MKYIYPLEPNADITEGLDDRVVDMLLNHRDKINEVVEVIDSYFNIEEPESRLTSKEVQQIEMADDLREILRPYHKEGESYITTLKELLSSPEKKEEESIIDKEKWPSLTKGGSELGGTAVCKYEHVENEGFFSLELTKMKDRLLGLEVELRALNRVQRRWKRDSSLGLESALFNERYLLRKAIKKAKAEINSILIDDYEREMNK